MSLVNISYITPSIVKYENVDNLLENTYSQPLFYSKDYLSIDDLLKENFVCIVGEPGIGKSRLIEELKTKISPEPFCCKASSFTSNLDSTENEYCIIDALDEVGGYLFYSKLQSIKQYHKEHPNVKLLFTCRKHYVASNVQHFTDCTNLIFIELHRLKESDVMNVVSSQSFKISKESIMKSPKLKELITIPRYLMFFLEYSEQNGECKNIGELFDYMIVRSIETAIESYRNNSIKENYKTLIQRVLEKVAFVMEIGRKDQILKDELYTILDEIKGNMAQLLISNLELLFFENRILKNTNGVLQFENTEIQEYLAAKELCRHDNIESVLYDVTVQKELGHIYINWYDVIPHISYMKDKIHAFINILKLIISYESDLENESFEGLLKYVDPSILSYEQKNELFSIVFDHYQHIPAYITFRGPMSYLMQKCYTSRSDTILKVRSNQLNNIQLFNIYVILDAIIEGKKLSKSVSEYWVQGADDLMATGDNLRILTALDLYGVFSCEEKLVDLSESYGTFANDQKEKFCQITGYGKYTNKEIVDCWLGDCYERNPYAINAVLCIEDLPTIKYVYNRIMSPL